MRNNYTLVAIVILVVANQIAVLSDALMKIAGEQASVFEILLYRQLCTLMLLLPLFLFTKNKLPQKPLIHVVRGHLWLAGSGCMVVALMTLPLATANALFYAAPIMMLPLGMWLHKSTVNRTQMVAATIGFIGVLVIIRPTEFNWGAAAALGTALTLALSNLTVKYIPKQESVVTSLFWTNVMVVPATLLLAWPELHGINWELVTLAGGSSLFILFLHAGSVVAYRTADANTIASAEYTGLIGAAVVGWVSFNEMPDALTWLGAAMIVLPLVLIGKRSLRKPKSKDTTAPVIDN
ncbi:MULTISPECIES: DMT family transporter [unclassified Agarivorans]|uniref:DMT family transporter n=1 Tax=unclassified Agarivorans TaxID=2636026 RepID=UPI0026E2E2D4|nr:MULTISPECIES: DMT family transporter [unclassified Agarivorans]MDO6685616.1 DMT family transporter [Agarivorans sp. 3_MG-2023]MDO6716002.1 DMT family transporter [Agarivorans sp. 2_MG-2023]